MPYFDPFVPGRLHENKGLSQDLKIGCPNLTILKYFGVLFSRETTQNTQITTINM